ARPPCIATPAHGGKKQSPDSVAGFSVSVDCFLVPTAPTVCYSEHGEVPGGIARGEPHRLLYLDESVVRHCHIKEDAGHQYTDIGVVRIQGDRQLRLRNCSFSVTLLIQNRPCRESMCN